MINCWCLMVQGSTRKKTLHDFMPWHEFHAMSSYGFATHFKAHVECLSVVFWKEQKFVPIVMNGVAVLIEEAKNTWRATPSIIESRDTDGIVFTKSKTMEDSHSAALHCWCCVRIGFWWNGVGVFYSFDHCCFMCITIGDLVLCLQGMCGYGIGLFMFA